MEIISQTLRLNKTKNYFILKEEEKTKKLFQTLIIIEELNKKFIDQNEINKNFNSKVTNLENKYNEIYNYYSKQIQSFNSKVTNLENKYNEIYNYYSKQIQLLGNTTIISRKNDLVSDISKTYIVANDSDLKYSKNYSTKSTKENTNKINDKMHNSNYLDFHQFNQNISNNKNLFEAEESFISENQRSMFNNNFLQELNKDSSFITNENKNTVIPKILKTSLELNKNVTNDISRPSKLVNKKKAPSIKKNGIIKKYEKKPTIKDIKSELNGYKKSKKVEKIAFKPLAKIIDNTKRQIIKQKNTNKTEFENSLNKSFQQGYNNSNKINIDEDLDKSVFLNKMKYEID